MRRREFISGLAGAAAWPSAGRAQLSATIPVIGFLNAGLPEAFAPYVAAFRQGLKESGYVEGRNVAIEFRWAGGRYDRLPALANDLVQRKVTVIVVSGGAVSARAAQAITLTIPILFVIGDDPVKSGVVSSLSRPSGNITGLTLFISTLTSKRFELLSEVSSVGAPIALLLNPNNPNAETEANNIQGAIRTNGRALRLLYASTESEIESAFASLVVQRGALLLGTDPFFYSQRDKIVALASRHGIPTIYFVREFAAVGGLMSYGPSFEREWRQAAMYAGRILKGEKPSELPVMQPTSFELIINLKTARALSLTMPETLLAIADEVIQ
jgi:putative ABC transport system substrate-binding protein